MRPRHNNMSETCVPARLRCYWTGDLCYCEALGRRTLTLMNAAASHYTSAYRPTLYKTPSRDCVPDDVQVKLFLNGLAYLKGEYNII